MERKAASRIMLTLLLVSMFTLVSRIQEANSTESPSIEWNKKYAGATTDDMVSQNTVIQTSDEGYAIAGTTSSFGNGARDFWLIETDANGNMQLNKTYGGANIDYARSVIQTSDGGYSIVGNSLSFSGGHDGWLVKTDADGNMQWNKVFGGGGVDDIWSVIQTNDGGYALIGNTGSMGAGYYDFWLIRTDVFGNVLWQKTYGGSDAEVAMTVVQTNDGGYALSGATSSFGAGGPDFWLVKTDADGNMQWNKTYGGTGSEEWGFVVLTSDGGYCLAGYTTSFGAGDSDFWLVKADSSGNMQWNRTYGGVDNDRPSFKSMIQTNDMGFALVGTTDSFGAGGNDFWLVKVGANGNMQWNETYGEASDDAGWSVVQTLDGGFALSGFTNSRSGNGRYEAWLIKLTPESTPVPEFPLGSAMPIAVIPLLLYLWWKRKQKAPP